MSVASDSLESIGLAISFLTALIFSFLYEANKDSFESGVIACIAWFVLGTYFFLVFAVYTSNVISLLFIGIGLTYVIRLIAEAFMMKDPIRQLTEDRY